MLKYDIQLKLPNNLTKGLYERIRKISTGTAEVSSTKSE